jgi:hypothetical protein
VPVGVFSVLFVAAAAALAIWIVVRFPERAPSEFLRAMIHFGVSMAGLYLLVPILDSALDVVAQPYQAHLSLFAVLLPAFVYRLVSVIWILRLAQGALGPPIR